MNNTEYKARMVRAKTHEVIDYHRDADRPGKPLYLLVPGALIALAALGLIIFIGYRVWIDTTLAQAQGLTLMSILAPFYAGDVFLFSYGYELYNLPRALRLTVIIVFITVAAVVMVAVLLVVLGAAGSSKSSSSSSNHASSHSGSSGSNTTAHASSNGSGVISGIANTTGRVVGGVVSSASSSHTSHVITREVIREVPVAAAVLAPLVLACPFCKRSYTPAESKFACPNCGAVTPPELLDNPQPPP